MQTKNRSILKNDGITVLAVISGFLLIITAPQNLKAIGFLIPNQDAAAIARGNAFAATADDPAAIYYNPAGITQGAGQELQLGDLNYLGLNVHYRSASDANHFDSDFHVLPVPQLFYTFSPTNLPISFGVGLYAPFGLGVDWPQNSSFRSIALDSKLEFSTLNPVIAWKILPSLSVAAGPTINYAKIEFTRGLISSSDFYEFSGHDFAYGFTAGILWQPHPMWSFGATYRLATTMNFRGNSTYNPGGPNFTSTTTASIPFPQIASGGISFRPTPHWNIEADVDYINWNTINNVTLNGTKNIFGSNLALPLNWHDSWQYKLGVTRSFDNGWFVSGGYFFTSDTTSSEFFTPAVPDANLNVGSLGFGHKGVHWDWAVAGQIIAGERTVNQDAGNSNPFTGQTAAGKYQLFIPTLTFSVAYRF